MEKSENSPTQKSYHGSCHCGLFKFTLTMAPLETVWACNCSLCSRNGYLWIHPVAEKDFVITQGREKELHSYEHAMRGTTHLFCNDCGSSVMARRRDAPEGQSLRINARMLEDIDLKTLQVKRFNAPELGPRSVSQHELDEKEKAVETPENKKTYKGNCHCGKFKFSIKTPELKIQICNCSICTKVGYLWVYPVVDEDFAIETGDGTLHSYEFGAKTMSHLFCPDCGTTVMIKKHDVPAGKAIGINARALQERDLSSFKTSTFPGADIGSTYQPPAKFPTIELGQGEKHLQIYYGNCHCGAVSYAVKTKPFSDPDVKVMSCNCSHCSRNGDLFIYPLKSAVSLSGGENLTGYPFLSETALHSFCKICSVSVIVNLTDPKEDGTALNVRTIKEIDLRDLKYKYYDGWNAGEKYVVT